MATANLNLPELGASQNQKYLTVNTAFNYLDGLIQLSVLSRTINIPPASPSEGDRYIIGPAPTGIWSGLAGRVAIFIGTAWQFFTPQDGWQAFDIAAGEYLLYQGTWQSIGNFLSGTLMPVGGTTITADFTVTYGSSVFELNEFGLGLNASADASNQFTFYGQNVLFNSPDSISQVFNKNGVGDDARFTFQQGFTTYALMGLLGDNNFTIKVGTSGATALIAHEETGAVELPQNPKFEGNCNYDQYNAADVWFKVDINNMIHNDWSAVTTGVFTAPHAGYYNFGGGITHKLNGTAPTYMAVGISINGAAPVGRTIQKYTADMTDGEASVQTTALLKLAANDTVELQAFFATNDGYVEASTNYFWGFEVP